MYLQSENILKRLSCTLIAALLLVTAGSSYAEDAGNVESVTGFVTVTNSEGEVRRLKPGETLEYGDTITTGEDSSVTILLANGETITIGASETFALVKDIGDDSDEIFADRPLGGKSNSLSTATSAGGTSTTPGTGGSPTN